MRSLHRRLAVRLFLGFLTVSVIVGGVVAYLDLEEVDHQVVELASTATETFLRDNHDALVSPNSPEARAVLAHSADRLLAGHFVIVELYDAARQPLIERSRGGYDAVEAHLDRSPHRFPTDERAIYQKHFIQGIIYLQVLAPVRGQAGRPVAYFEGIYEVDAAVMAAIRYRVLHSLGIVVLSVLATTLLLYPAIVVLNRDVLRFSDRLLQANLEMLEVLGSAIAKRDSDTDAHNYRVTWYAVRLAETAGLEQAAICQLIKGAFLHDVGKIGISDAILLKPGKLTAEEFAAMQRHVAIGIDIVGRSDWLAEASDIVQFHHEKFDGSGYLKGLRGEDIPMAARIFAIVDVFDALTSRRPYKEPIPLDRAVAILDEGSGSHFDPRLLALFRERAASWLKTTATLGEDGLHRALRDDIHRYFFA